MTILPLPPGPVAAVVAHPDDESFGLGGLLAAIAAEGRAVHVLWFSLGEIRSAIDVLVQARRR